MVYVEAITFDLWQTLIIDNRELGRARTQKRLEDTSSCLNNAGYDFTSEHLLEAYRNCYRTCKALHNQEKDFTFDEQIRIFIDSIEPDLSNKLEGHVIDRITHYYGEAFFDFPAPMASGALETLKKVQDKGYKIGLISNTGMTPGVLFRRYFQDKQILEFFQSLIFSDEVRLTKPSKQIFDITLRELETDPAKAVLVGDHIRNDVLGANLAGMQSILLGKADGQERLAEPHTQISMLEELPEILSKVYPLG